MLSVANLILLKYRDEHFKYSMKLSNFRHWTRDLGRSF